MAIGKLKAPVGDVNAKRKSGLAPAKNSPADVVILRELLSVNGYGKESTSRKVDQTLLNCIKLAEIHMGGGTDKDLVIDPGDTVHKKLVKGYNIKKKKEKETVYKVVVNNKNAYVNQKQYGTIKANLLISMGRLAKAFRSQQKHNYEVWKEYNDVARLEKGLIKASVHATSSILGGVGSIDHRKITIQNARVTSFEAAVTSKDLAKIKEALPKAEKATREAYVEVQTFLAGFSKGAGRGATTMTITSTAAFTVVGAMAGPILVTGAGLSAAQAAVAAGSGVALLESSSKELGRKVAGEKVTAWSSAKVIMVDTIIGGLTAGIGAKLPVDFIDKAAKSLVAKVTQKLPKLSTKVADTMIRKYLATGSAEMLKEACAEATKICGNMVKTGKSPTAKDFQEAFVNVIFKGMTAGVLKNFSKFETKVAVKTKETLTQQMVPKALAKYVASDKISKLNRARIIKGVLTKFNENMAKIAFSQVVSKSKADQAVTKMLQDAGTYLTSDKSLQTKVDATVLKLLKEEGLVA